MNFQILNYCHSTPTPNNKSLYNRMICESFLENYPDQFFDIRVRLLFTLKVLILSNLNFLTMKNCVFSSISKRCQIIFEFHSLTKKILLGN